MTADSRYQNVIDPRSLYLGGCQPTSAADPKRFISYTDPTCQFIAGQDPTFKVVSDPDPDTALIR